MKTYGILQTQQLLSILTDDNGNPRLDTLCPPGQYHLTDLSAPWNQAGAVSYNSTDYPGLLWTPPEIAPLVKLPYPETASNQIAEPILVWTETSVTRDWQIRDMTASELADSIRKTWQHCQQFIAEFTMAEISAISLSTDPTIAALRLILSTWLNSVYSDDTRIVAGLDAIQTAGIITAERRVQILTK